MLKNVEQLLNALSYELTQLHLKWLLFSQLYVDKEIVDLLNESAPTFFGVCQTVLLDDIILAISRLTDPSRTGKKSNLTLERLLDAIDPSLSLLKNELEELLKDARSNCDFARTSRNRRVAHTDLDTYFQEMSEPLPSITKEKIEKALLSLRTFMNKVELHFEQNETGYEYLAVVDGGNSLIGCLYDARNYRDKVG